MLAPLVTLTTDFGLEDTYVGQMKGVIQGIAPGAVVVDLTHAIAPQRVATAATILDDAVDAFPAGTVHVAVVDPGVGSPRRLLAARAGDQLFVAPDNGLLTACFDRLGRRSAVALPVPPTASATFHGRDVFAPAGARLAAGASPEALGEPVGGVERIALPRPETGAEGRSLRAHVLYADRFGNLVTDLTRRDISAFAGNHRVRARAGKRDLGLLRRTFADVAPGEALAYIGSAERLEVAVRDGSAAGELGARPGDEIRVELAADG